MSASKAPKMGKPVILENVNRQPASLAVSVIMSDCEAEERFLPNAALALTPFEMGTDLWSIHACVLLMDDDGEINDDFEAEAGCHFSGSKKQINDVLHQFAMENLAGEFFAYEVGLGEALERKKRATKKKSDYWHVPLIVTGNQRLIDPFYGGGDDPANRIGPSFDFYRQDWNAVIKEGYARFTSESEKSILDLAAIKNFQTAYPAQFVATYQKSYYDADKNTYISEDTVKKEKGSAILVDAWDFSMLEPYASHYLMTLGSLELVQMAHHMMDDMFQKPGIKSDMKQYALQKFNANHHSIVCGAASRAIPGTMRSHIYSKFLSNQSLS